jgi:hypothetical protein
LFERRTNSSSASNANIMEQMGKSHNKNQKKKLIVKGKLIVKKFNRKEGNFQKPQ